MATKRDLRIWILEALRAYQGGASLVEICRFIWENHENELRVSGGSLLYLAI